MKKVKVVLTNTCFVLRILNCVYTRELYWSLRCYRCWDWKWNKKRIVKSYEQDLESSEERLEQWKNGDVSAAERRILFTKWLGDAWDDFTKNYQSQITRAFKKCGMYNDINGKENHLIKLDRYSSYVPLVKDYPPAVVHKKKRKKT